MNRFAYIIDGDEAGRASTKRLLAHLPNLQTLAFETSEAFLESLEERDPGVLLLNPHADGMHDLDVLRHTQSCRRAPWPTIVITGKGDVNEAVAAMRLGALDVLEAPYDPLALLECVENGLAQLDRSAAEQRNYDFAQARMQRLTPREREVLSLVIQGLLNKQIAQSLAISLRTVEVHRANLMGKLEAASIPQAVHLAIAAGMSPFATDTSRQDVRMTAQL